MKAAVAGVSTVDKWEPSNKIREISEIKTPLHRWDKKFLANTENIRKMREGKYTNIFNFLFVETS